MAEFLPVSSSGHLILVREFFNISAERGLAVDAVLQLATALAVVVYFSRDLKRLVYTAFRRIAGHNVPREDLLLIFSIVVGTVPAVTAGLFLEETMETIFRSAELVAYALIAGSVVMLLAEYVSKKYRATATGSVTVWAGLVVGFFQALALIPGMSRSGMTISGGLFLGLSREAAARFGFLLAIPIILGSGMKKLF